MDPASEELTTFRTRYGTYCYKVLPFGLTNGPATFQRYINDVLMPFLDVFCSAYMDDIIVFSKNANDHRSHVKDVLQKLREAGLHIDVDKCEFDVTETKFLGLIVTTSGVRMDPEKIRAIQEWGVPRSVVHVQRFLGFCNFYRRFIRDYGRIARALSQLTRKGITFQWTLECQKAFETLKRSVSEAPVLRHFDPDKQSTVETDSSDWTNGGVLSQENEDGVLCPVAYFSKNLTPAECNYEIYDKELLAIIRCFEQWRLELEGTELPVKVLIDYKALKYFITTKKLTRR
jgi:hypothetical protein